MPRARSKGLGNKKAALPKPAKQLFVWVLQKPMHLIRGWPLPG
jgi:hypothetical protein